jgi:hypothetical protein
MNQVNETTALNNPMAKTNKALKAKAKAISAKTSDLITKATKGVIGVRGVKALTLDALQADGIKSFDLEIPKQKKANANEGLHNSIKIAIISAFADDVQALLKKEPKTLEDMERSNKRYWQQQIASEFAYYRRELKKREERESKENDEKATPVEMYFKTLQNALDRLTKLEELDFDLVAHTSALKKLLADK